jgi:hypothetical protein
VRSGLFVVSPAAFPGPRGPGGWRFNLLLPVSAIPAKDGRWSLHKSLQKQIKQKTNQGLILTIVSIVIPGIIKSTTIFFIFPITMLFTVIIIVPIAPVSMAITVVFSRRVISVVVIAC